MPDMRRRRIINGTCLGIVLLTLLTMCSIIATEPQNDNPSPALVPTETYTPEPLPPEPIDDPTTTVEDLPNLPHVDVHRPRICHRKWYC